jgi:hypothetical protein
MAPIGKSGMDPMLNQKIYGCGLYRRAFDIFLCNKPGFITFAAPGEVAQLVRASDS